MKVAFRFLSQRQSAAGKPYKIVDVSDIPSDRTFRNAWEIDPSILTDGVGADSDEFPARGES